MKAMCSKHLPITSYSKSIIGSKCSMPPSHSACHTKFHPCVASLPGYSERLASEKNTTHLVHSDLLEHAMVRKSRCESTGRCTDCEFARGVGKRHTFCPPARRFLPTKQLHFRSLPDNTVVYSNLLINIPQCGIRENTHTSPVSWYGNLVRVQRSHLSQLH